MSKLTELVFIIDQSGSMSGREEDVVGSFNSTLATQKENDTEGYVTVLVFSDDHKTVFDRVPLNEVREMTLKDYNPGGCTALIDTIGYGIDHITRIHKYVERKPERTLFVIITDGLENASHKYSSDQVKRMIEAKKEDKWEFLFLGANIDAVETAKTYGIREDRAVNFISDERGIKSSMSSVKRFFDYVANCEDEELECILDSGEWRREADEDFNTRK